jgi:hypothetical protein
MSKASTESDSPNKEVTDASRIRAELDVVWLHYIGIKTRLAKLFVEMQFFKAEYAKCVLRIDELTHEHKILSKLISENFAKGYLNYPAGGVVEPASVYLERARQLQVQLPYYFAVMNIHRDLQRTYKSAFEHLEETYFKETLDNDTYWRQQVRSIYKSSEIELAWMSNPDSLDDCVLSTGQLFRGNILDNPD